LELSNSVDQHGREISLEDFCPKCRSKATRILERMRILEEFFNRQFERFGPLTDIAASQHAIRELKGEPRKP